MRKKPTIASRRIPRVMTVISMRGSFGAEVMRGVFAHLSGASDWGLEIVRSSSEFTTESVRVALAHKIDGILVALNDGDEDAFAALAAADIPFAAVETYSPSLLTRKANAIHVRIDNADIGREAARSFFAQGRFATFAYVPNPVSCEWSRLREVGFREMLEKRRISCVTFTPPSETISDSVSLRGHLARWLRRLTPPVALFAADDNIAHNVLQACRAARLAVPNTISILGVDNEVLICEHTAPTLSSIQPDFEGAGHIAAKMLDRLMQQHGKKPPPAEALLATGKCETVLRASTSRETTGGPLVQKAITFIERNAKRGIGPKDVVEHLKVSRALVDLRFREVRGISLLNTILDARLRELKRLLATTDNPIESITRRLGWTSPNYPKNLFKKRFGITMLDFRKSHRP